LAFPDFIDVCNKLKCISSLEDLSSLV
jgi:hypothetical protein